MLTLVARSERILKHGHLLLLWIDLESSGMIQKLLAPSHVPFHVAAAYLEL